MNIKRQINIYRDTSRTGAVIGHDSLVFKGRDRRNFPGIGCGALAALSSLGCLRWWNALYGGVAQTGERGWTRDFIRKSVALRPRKLWTRSGSQDAAAKYRLHYAPYYPRLHSAFEGRLLGRGPRGGGSKIQEIPPWKSLSAPPQRVRIEGGQVRLLAFWKLFVRNL